MKLSRSLVEIELSWCCDMLTLNKGRNLPSIGVGVWFKICVGSIPVAEHHMFCITPFNYCF